MHDAELAVRLWDLADAVTAFAILQSVALAYALTKDEVASRVAPVAGWVIFGMLFIVLLECVAVVGLAVLGGGIRPQHSDTWRLVTFGRVGGILAFSVVVLLFIAPATKAFRGESGR